MRVLKVPVNEVELGDWVLFRDPKTGTEQPCQVMTWHDRPYHAGLAIEERNAVRIAWVRPKMVGTLSGTVLALLGGTVQVVAPVYEAPEPLKIP